MQSATSPIDIPREDSEEPRFVVRDVNNEDTNLDLNDHRGQPSSMPRSEGSSRPRRGTFASMYDGQQPDLLRVDQALAINDNAVVEDDAGSLVGSPQDGRPMFGRRGSVSPAVARRSTVRRQRPNISRDSSSSRSSSRSPPNSVHAFAEGYRRRERAGTVNSKAASSVDLPLNRTTSRGSHSRRPTFSGRDDRSDGGHSSAEEDVCYPGSEARGSDTYSIDYSELDELVEEQELERAQVEAQISPTIAGRPGSPLTPKLTLDKPKQGATTSDEDFDELEKHKIGRAGSIAEPPRASRQNLEKRSWTFFSSELDDVIHSSTIGGLLEEGETFQHLFELPMEGGGCWWLDALNATEDEVAALCKAFGVHSLTREDIVTKDQREKIELFKTYYFVSFRSFYQNKEDEDYLDPVSHYAIVFKQGLLTFSSHQGPHTKNMLQRIGRLRDYMSLNSDWICYAMIDDIVDSFMPVIRDIEQEVDRIEDEIFVSRDEDARPMLQKIAESRKKAMSLLRLLGNKPDVIKGFAKRCNEGYAAAPSTNVGMYLSDIQDHILTYRDNLTHSEQLLSRLHNNFLAQLNVEHIASGNRVNRLLGKVTLIATIIVPLNLVTGLFGMNVPVPGRETTSLAWFFGIVGFLLMFCVVSLAVAKRMRLI